MSTLNMVYVVLYPLLTAVLAPSFSVNQLWTIYCMVMLSILRVILIVFQIDVKAKLKELNSIDDPKLFEEKVMSYFSESFHDMGYSKPVVFSNEGELLTAATIHYTLTPALKMK